jgi:hypothetical protein
MAVGTESFYSMAVSLFRILSRAEEVGVLEAVLSSFSAFFR